MGINFCVFFLCGSHSSNSTTRDALNWKFHPVIIMYVNSVMSEKKLWIPFYYLMVERPSSVKILLDDVSPPYMENVSGQWYRTMVYSVRSTGCGAFKLAHEDPGSSLWWPAFFLKLTTTLVSWSAVRLSTTFWFFP
jgi:hypothetical protein